MANLSEETIGTVLNLQRRVLQLINEATATEFILLEQYGETEATISDLEILQNVRERGTTYYVRLCCFCRLPNPNLWLLLLR